jgi:7-cyano-7-deazaguanine synthase
MSRAGAAKAGRDAVVLLSGGLDSATVLALARSQGFRVRALSFDYGQRHRTELSCAAAQAAAHGVVSHVTARVDLAIFGGSALTDRTLAVPKARRDAPAHIPITYVPARNTIFLSYALALAETASARHIFIGANAVDYSGYPDCRPEYLNAFQAMAALATRAAVEDPAAAPVICAPLLMWTKRRIIEEGARLGVDFSMTSSCYDPNPDTGAPCRACDSCAIRAKAFAELGYDADPAVARHHPAPQA